MILGVDSEWTGFLEKLSQKRDGEPFIHYQYSLHFLTALIGKGDLSDWYYIVDVGFIAPYRTLLMKWYPNNRTRTFAGINSQCGVQLLLSKHYLDILGEKKYRSYVAEHNFKKSTFLLFEIYALENKYIKPERPYPLMKQYEKEIDEALSKSKPEIHIELTPYERARGVRFELS